MAVNRQANFLGQQRIDIPHLRALESSVCYDFDAVGLMLTGGVPCVVKGFDVVNYATCIGSNASTITVDTAGSLLCHPEASDSGSFFEVPATRDDETLNSSNPRVVGSWTPGVDNFVGVDLLRSADNTTVDTVRFINTTVDVESDERVPLARTLDYVITISTSPFSVSPTICPLNIITLDSNSAVTAVIDARNLLFRMADGGDAPASNTPFSWPGGRNEGDSTTAYVAGDRSIRSMKEWMSATMTRLQEIAGGEYWYSLTADRNVRMAQGGSVFASTGEAFEWVTNNLHWKGLKFVFDNSTGHINEIADQLTDLAGLTNLADGDCLYVDLDRTESLTGSDALIAQKAALSTLGGSTVPGQRWVLAYRIGSNIYVRDQSYPVGSSFKLATTVAAGTLKTTINLNGDDTTAPIAVGLGDSAAAYYTATCGGLSHNIDLSVTVLLAHNNLVVGRGHDAGDDNIYIQTDDAALQTVIYGNNVTTERWAPLRVIQGSQTPSIIDGGQTFDMRIANFAVAQDGGDTDLPSEGGDDSINKVTIGVDGSIAMAHTLRNPSKNPFPFTDDSHSPARSKLFFRPDKVWLEAVRCILHYTDSYDFGPTSAYTWSPITGDYTWEKSSVGKIYGMDGSEAGTIELVAEDRILVWAPFTDLLVDDKKYYGIYEVVVAGGASTKAVIKRTDDANSYSTIFQGITVQISEGYLAGTHIKLNTLTPITIDTTPLDWAPTNSAETRDQLCVQWWNGSSTVVCQSPPFVDSYPMPS
jgi:hypothetical protein